MLKLQVKMEEKRQERPPEKPVYYKLCWRLSNVWLVDTFCRNTMTSINTSFKNLVRIWWNNDRKLAQHSALNTRQTTASLHIGGHVSRNQCTRRFMSGVCFHQIVLMFVCSLVTLNRLMRLKNTQHEENVHRVLLRASVFSLLGSASPLASLWHKSARLTHCLRWSQAEDMAAPTPRCPTFPLAHIHQQQTTKPPPPPHTPGIPIISPCLLRDFRDHIAYRSGALPPATIYNQEAGWGHTLAQHGSARLSTAPLTTQTSHWSSLFMTFSSWLLIHENCIIFQT